MAASSLDPQDPSIRYPAEGGDPLLPIAAIYGANASGKTNVLRAMQFFQYAVDNSHTSWKPNSGISREPFGHQGNRAPTRFDVNFYLQGVRYNYGFSFDSEQFLEEWLYCFPSTKRVILFLRKAKEFSFGKALSGNKKAIESLVRPNSLFLSAAAQNNHELLLSIYNWISGWLVIIDGREGMVRITHNMCSEPAVSKLLLEMVKTADLGITGMQTKEREISPEVVALVTNFANSLPESDAREFREQTLEKNKLEFSHAGPNGEQFTVDSSDESKGTMNYLGLIGPISLCSELGHLMVVDELDESLHPSLIKGLIRLFTSRQSNKNGAQLIFNTHDTNLLDLDLLRRDEIWFTEKDPEGASHLYPLTDFKPRNSENVKKGYIEGRYGAVPFIGDFTRLFSQEGKPE